MVQKDKKSKKDKEVQEKEHEQNLQIGYGAYAKRIEARQATGEKIELKPFEDWVRKVKKTIDGIETEVTVVGDSGETGKERFKRLIDYRMTKALGDLDQIINLSSPAYESTESDHTQIVNALRLKVIDIESAFKTQKKETPAFSLKQTPQGPPDIPE